MYKRLPNHNEVAARCRELLTEWGVWDLQKYDLEIYRFAKNWNGTLEMVDEYWENTVRQEDLNNE